MAERVAAVVVTYNRKVLLGECLDGLLRQTRAPDAIFLIDNASTDGTGEYVAERGYLREGKIEYIRLESNTGGAGGFHAGVKHAFEAGYDWFWLMDDDVEPLPDGLAQLLPYCRESGCIHGRRRNPDNSSTLWGEVFNPRTVTCRAVPGMDFSGREPYRQVNVGCFEGMLVSRRVIEQIGLPDAEFFIVHDDTFFGYLASRVTRVLYVNAFTLKRKRAVESIRGAFAARPDWPKLSPTALYYFSRNRFLMAKRLGNYSLPFMAASLRILFRSLCREFLVTRSLSGARAVMAGFWNGAKAWARPGAKRHRGAAATGPLQD